MSVIIAGSRDLAISTSELDCIIKESKFKIKKLVCGMCPTGIDAAAVNWAKENGIPIEEYPADWEKYGKSAGPIRNRLMATKAEKLIVIYRKDNLTPGTKNMIESGKKLTIFTKCI